VGEATRGVRPGRGTLGALRPQLRDVAGSELVEVGWGERDFYIRAGGYPITPLSAVTAGNVMYQATAFCGGGRAR
jgi:hypothetical protein